MRNVPLICILFCLALALAGCGRSEKTAAEDAGTPGVTDDLITLGSSLPLSGHAGYLGTQTLQGARAYIRYVNEQGGVHGRRIRIEAADDSYDPPQCLANTQRFIIDKKVFALFCYVGTPTTVKALPLVEDARVPLIGMFTGANALRQPPNRYVINIRASYYQETMAAVRHMVEDLGLTKIAVFYQYDAYGFDGLIGTELALKKFELEPVARGSYIRGTLDVQDGLDRIRKSGAEAVVMIGTYGACARFINLSEEEGYNPIFYTVSFVGAEELAWRVGRASPAHVFMSQVVPPPVESDDVNDSASNYVKLLRRYYPDDTPSFVGLEGFLNAEILVEGLRRAGRDLTREGFIRAIESIKDFKLGPNLTITYGPYDRQGLDAIHFTKLHDGKFIPFTDWAEFKRELGEVAMSLGERIAGRFTRIGLREKLLFSMLAAVLFISVAIALVSRYILVSSLTNELEMRGFAIAHSVAERGGSYILDNDIPKLLVLIFDEARLRQRKDLVAYIFIEDQAGHILAHTLTHKLPDNLRANTLPPGKADSIKLMELGNQEVYDLAAAINEGLYRIGTVHVGLNKRHIDTLVGKLRVAFLGFISAVVVITIILSSWLSKYITKPVSDLTRLSDEISRGNFDIPLKLGSGEDWDSAECPAFTNTDLPCWHFDQSRSGQTPAETHRKCADCAFYRKHQGDEVVQLGDSFRNMVWSIKLYRRRLRESEEKYRSLFDSGPDPIFVVDCASGTIRDANPRTTELYGYPREDLLGMPFLDLGPEHNAACLDFFTEGGGACVYYPKRLHYKNGGEPFFVNMHACPISYRGKQAIIIAVTDITELIEKDAQLIQAAKMKSLGEMSAGVAHEINQPLNAIKVGSEFLSMMREEDLEIPKEHFKEVVNEISTQVDRAAEIIDTLRSFGRKSDLMEESVDLNQPVRAVLSMVRRQFELDNIRFELELAEGLSPVQAHSNRLQQVIFNLVTNARDAINDVSNADTGGDRRIIIRTGNHDRRVFLEVKDTGGGIDEKDQQKIFEPFFTTKEAGQGMGLGLAITYGIIKDYGGEIRIDSTKGHGTVFRMEFPAAAARGESKA